MNKGARVPSGASLIRTLIPFMRAPLSSPNYFSKFPPPNTTTLEIRFQHVKCGDTNIQSIAVTEF